MAQSQVFTASCPNCNAAIRVKTRSAEKSVACPACKTSVTVRVPSAPGHSEVSPAAPNVFAGVPPIAPPPLVDPAASPAPPVEDGVPPEPFALVPPSAVGLGRRWQQRGSEYLQRASRATGLDPVTVVCVGVGLFALLVVLTSSLGCWYYTTYTDVIQKEIGTPQELLDEWYRGISFVEGKIVFVAAMAAGVWVVLGVLKRQWLPGGLVTAGSVGLFSVFLLLALRSNLNREYAQLEAVMRQMGKAIGSKVGGGVGVALGLCIVAAAAAAVSFFVTALHHPLPLGFLTKTGYPPVVQKHGATIAGFTLAALLGIALAVIRY